MDTRPNTIYPSRSALFPPGPGKVLPQCPQRYRYVRAVMAPRGGCEDPGPPPAHTAGGTLGTAPQRSHREHRCGRGDAFKPRSAGLRASPPKPLRPQRTRREEHRHYALPRGTKATVPPGRGGAVTAAAPRAGRTAQRSACRFNRPPWVVAGRSAHEFGAGAQRSPWLLGVAASPTCCPSSGLVPASRPVLRQPDCFPQPVSAASPCADSR